MASRKTGIELGDPDSVSQGEYLEWQDESANLTDEYRAWLERKRRVTKVTPRKARTRARVDP